MKFKRLFKNWVAVSLSLLLFVGLVFHSSYLEVEASGSDDLVYVSIPIESINGSDLQQKIISNPRKYFVLQNLQDNYYSENTLNSSNWSACLDTSFPSNLDSYFDYYFNTNKDKLRYEIVDAGIRTCQHYASYRVLGLRDLVKSNRWISSGSYYYNSNGDRRYHYSGLPAGGGYVDIPGRDLIGYEGYSTVRLTMNGFDNKWNNGGQAWGDAWGMWTAQERAISYVSKDASGRLNGAGSALCNSIDANWDKYLPWMVGYPTDDGGTHNNYSNFGVLTHLYLPNGSGGYNYSITGNNIYLNGSPVKVTYTWQGERQENVQLTASGLGMYYDNMFWNVSNAPNDAGFTPHYGTYVPNHLKNVFKYTNPAYGGLGIHLNNATARLVGEGACQYHTSDAHVDLDGAYYSGGSYNLAASEWSHMVHFYQLKVYMQNDRTVSYNPNGGSGTMASQTEPVGVPIVVKNNEFTRTGYTFTKWSGSDSNIYYGGSSYNGSTNLTLYAIWERNQSNLKVVPNGGIWTYGGINYSEPHTISRWYGDVVNIPNPSRNYYSFSGWTFGGDSNGTFAHTTGNYTFGAGSGKTDTLTANWTPNIYTISCAKKGGSGGTDTYYERYGVQFQNGSGTAISSITPPTRTGYIFQGYYSQDTGTNGTTVGASNVLVVDSSGNLTVGPTFFTSNYTVYALWKPIEYQIKYEKGATNCD